MVKNYLTASLINAWIYGYDNLLDMLYRREREPNQNMLNGISFEEKAIRGEIQELRNIVNDSLYQEFVCKECEGYMLLGFCDLIKDDTIYDLKYVSSYEMPKYTDSVQHLIYLYCTDMQKFQYIIGKGEDIFYESQSRNDEKLKEIIHQFVDWLKINDLYGIYQQNYNVERYKEQIENYLNW